ncbi:heparinase II/III domain-containing protein [Membranihabitans marinus]|uniref:heparinase II/III domain-containing protein n=1 Tax=Membranihabitans marinus TaxID=1227546 RepID=UPI001F32FF88|nr:heparinase II/III family protein [Membranihabitans marinus]
MKYFILFLVSCSTFILEATPYEKRNLLQKQVSKEELFQFIQKPEDWIPYPQYNDRGAWDEFLAGAKESLIQAGESYLDYQWQVVKLSDYLEFEKSGSRDIMQKPFGDNNSAMSALVLAELAEGKGRFMDQILNGTWLACEMTTWVLSAHLRSHQTNKRSIPDPYEYTIDLTAGDLGSFYSWVYYFFKDEMDKVHPLVAQRLRQNLEDRILRPYMERDDFWWQAVDLEPGGKVNNWNPWCNFNVLTTFLLLESDKNKLVDAVYKSMVSVDQFINYNHVDGACEEGPSYWGHAAGKMFDYLDLLSMATEGKVDIFDQPIIRNLGEYIAKSYVGDGWVVNFADATARSKGKPFVIFRYGKAVESTEMKAYAAYLYESQKGDKKWSFGRDFFRAMEAFRNLEEIESINPSLPHYQNAWYAETEFCYMKNNSGFFFAGKGGYNAESHNHNDMGSFSLYYNQTPVLIDVGVGTYTRQTFSSERYSIWTMQSEYHNLPLINGQGQMPGHKYRSKNVVFDDQNQIFQLDLARAYGDEAKVKEWTRQYKLLSNGLQVKEEYSLAEVDQPSELHFMTWGKPTLIKPGQVKLVAGDETLILEYDPVELSFESETIEVTDNRLRSVWRERVYRIVLSLTSNAKQGNLTYLIKTM